MEKINIIKKLWRKVYQKIHPIAFKVFKIRGYISNRGPRFVRDIFLYPRVRSYAKKRGLFTPNKTVPLCDYRLDTLEDLDSMILGKLRLLQFGIPFQQAKLLITHSVYGGFGAAVPNHISRALLYSYVYNRTFLFDDSGLEYDFCYEPISSHCLKDISEEDKIKAAKFNFLPQKEKVVYRRFARAGFLERKLVYRHFNFVYPLTLSNSWLYASGLILEKFLKLKPKYKAHIEEKRKEIGFKNPIIGVHIRHGDAAVERYFSFQTYLKVIKQVVNKTGIKTVFVTTDSEEVIRQLPENSGIEFIYDDKEKRHNVDVARMLQVQPELKEQETLTAVKNIYLLADCDYVISGAAGSWFSCSRMLSFYRNKKCNTILITKEGVGVGGVNL